MPDTSPGAIFDRKTPSKFAQFGRIIVSGLFLTALGLGASGNAFAQDSATDDGTTEALSPDKAYLDENAKKEGVIVRPSGLQIKILRRAEGDIPGPHSTVVVHYEGKLVDGTIFDSSYARGVPAEFPVTGVIPGWTEALMLMQTGSMFELVIPADIAYGEDGSGGIIPPGATLIFKVELLAVK